MCAFLAQASLLHLCCFLFGFGALSWPRGKPHVGLVLAAIDKA